MTDQYQWQGALAAAEHAIRNGQIEHAADALRAALTTIGTYEPNDPDRLPILAALLRCCERAIERAAEQSLRAMKKRAAEVQHIIDKAEKDPPLTHSQAHLLLPDDIEERRRRGRLGYRLHRTQTSAAYMLLDSQSAQLGEDSTGVVDTLLTLDHLEWGHGRESNSFDLLQRALAIRERTLGKEHPDTVLVVWRLASRHESWTSFEQGIPHWQRLLAYAEQNGYLPIHNARYGVPQLLLLLGRAYNYSRRYCDALHTWKRYLKLTEPDTTQMAEQGAFEKYRLLEAYYGVGNAYLKLRDWTQAQSYLVQAIGKHRAVPDYSVNEGSGLSLIDLAQGIAAYAEAFSGSGEHDKALPFFAEAIALYKRRDRGYAKLLRDYAATLQAMGETEKAASAEHEASLLIERFATRRRHRMSVAAHPDRE